ncbi:hypothetical protein BQ8794_220216 [Mesorhizobium prunaredense]|uniref:Uncharacterized protein n=1 Tax=Mesorhizobium prunaredense TaxID=1631249 RepID=A0A1R3V704_9HYPH|nr:hypothetical protein BQ8794_220216 [Mesorhizobium prunaredense]
MPGGNLISSTSGRLSGAPQYSAQVVNDSEASNDLWMAAAPSRPQAGSCLRRCFTKSTAVVAPPRRETIV